VYIISGEELRLPETHVVLLNGAFPFP
jgi:hypothetical protein